MTASDIIVFSYSSDESVESPPSQVILFGDIPTVIPFISMVAPETSTTAPVISSVAPMIKTTIVASPIGLYSLVPYSDFDSNLPDEMDSLKVTTSSSSPSAFPIAPVTALPGTRRRAAILIRPREAIPLGRPYRTHPNGPRRVMAIGLPSDESTTTCEAFRRWCAASVSTFYPLTTSESSSEDSLERPLHSSSHSARPSRKRCRFPDDSVPSFTSVTGSLAPTRANLLPPRKRFRDSYSPETSMEKDIEIDTTETEDGRDAGDTVVLGIDPRSVPMDDEEIVEPVGGDSSSSPGTRDGTVRSVEDIPVDLDGSIRDFYHHMSKVRVDRIVRIKTTQRHLEAEQMRASRARAGMAESIKSLRSKNLKIRDDRDDLRRKLRRTMTNTRSRMTPTAIEEMINRRVAKALEAHEINKNLRLENGNGNGNSNGGNRNGNGGNGNGQGRNGNGDGRGDRPVARECTYQDFMKFQPLNFKGIEGVVGLIRWCEKMETMFHISNWPERYQVKYATCTLLDSALTWWNSHKRTIRTDTAYALS
uniref:Reverse transcriptase domain-containing protein n=1 Tax=Tanacetum cinerariifolium TaxID=118510 RepID=A0A6L2MFS1_TANCI|nr:reverse transcriptase domain-containing protein [Tanacetum cinerariifolium]